MADETQPASESGVAPARALIPLVLPPAGFTDPTAAFKAFPLANPVTVDGHSFSVIGIRRFTVGQVAAVMANYRENLALDPAAVLALPLYVDDLGQDLPPAVLDLITPDEADDLDEATANFLPRRFRAAPTTTEPAASASPDGRSTEPSS